MWKDKDGNRSWKIIWLLIILIIGSVYLFIVTNDRNAGYDIGSGHPADTELDLSCQVKEFNRFSKEYTRRTEHTMDEKSINEIVSEDEGRASAQELPDSSSVYAIQYLSWTTSGVVVSKVRLEYKPYGILTLKDKSGRQIMIYILGASTATNEGEMAEATGIVLGTLHEEGDIPVLVTTHNHLKVLPHQR